MALSKQKQFFYEFGSFRIDPINRLLFRNNELVPLQPKMFDTLLLLIENRGQVIGKDELMSRLWPDTIVEESNLTQNIYVLRKLLGADPQGYRYIETIPKRGYRFTASTEEQREDTADLVLEKRTVSHTLIEEQEYNRTDDQALALAQDTRGARTSKFAAIAALLIATVAALYFWTANPSNRIRTNSGVKSLAVLPFKPLNADSSDEYLGLGLADTLITRLSSTGRLIVRPTSAVRKYSGGTQDPLSAGREQGVESVLEGSIQRAGEKIRVTVRLLSVQDGSPLWAHTYDELSTDIFALQDAISERVISTLALRLSGEEHKLLTKRYTENAEAYHHYLKGRYFWNKRSGEDMVKAIEHFEEAIGRDPKYALAYAGLADCYVVEGLAPLPPAEAMPKAKEAAIKALELDGQLAEARTSLAFIRWRYDWDWQGADAEFQKSISLNPNYPTAHHWYALYLIARGGRDQSIAEIRRAQELDPVSLIISSDVGRILYYARQYDQAIDQLRKTIEMDKNFARAHNILELVYEEKAMYEEALAQHQEAATISGERTPEMPARRRAYAVSGYKGYLELVLDQLLQESKHGSVSPLAVAGVYAKLGRKDRAFEWLDKAYAEHTGALVYARVDPGFDGLRSDPRFDELLRRINLTRQN